MQFTYSSDNINPLGGTILVDQLLKNSGVDSVITEVLGNRDNRATYSFADVIKTLWLITLSGGDCAEDVNEHLKPFLKDVKHTQIPSADVLLGVQKSLATSKESFTTASKTEHDFNINLKLNKLLVKLLLHLKQLNPSFHDYTFDYDNQFIANEKYDSRYSYKKANGYFPGIATINDMPVYIENRNGNSNVKLNQAETLTRAYTLLKDNGIQIKRSRMDCGSFSKDIVATALKFSQYVYIRAMRCEELYNQLQNVQKWETVEINYIQYEVASIEYTPFGGNTSYRYVVSREKNKDGQLDLFSQDAFKYRAILTNDREMTDLEVILFYNDRAKSERVFDEMNNDFNWKRMPFSFLEENTVFMIIMAMCRNVYHFITDFLSKKINFIQPTFRLKKFIYRFMIVPTKWIRQGRRDILKLFTDKKYHLIFE